MKKVIIAFMVGLMGVLGVAGENNIQWSAKVGIGTSGWLGADADNTKAQFAYRVGVGLDLPIGKMWGFQTGLNFEGLGTSFETPHADYDLNVHQLYLEIPAMATTRFKLGHSMSLLCNFGPFFGLGVGGKAKASIDALGSKSVNSFGSVDDGNFGLRRLDFGLGFGASLDFNRFLIGLDTRFGLTSLAKSTSLHNYGVFVSAGYKF